VAGALGMDEELVKKALKDRFIIDTTVQSRLKEIFSTLFPTVIYGGGATGVVSARLATENNPALATMRMVSADNQSPNAPGQDDGLPMMVTPTSLSLETFGCPLFTVGQQLFIDFSTNTTADNFYGVVGVTHKIEAGKFTTEVKMSTMSSFGKWRSTWDNLKDMITNAAKSASEG
jgi:hypothetical protein